MIFDTLEKANLYKSLSPNFKKAFEWLEAAWKTELSPGRVDIDGDKVYALVQKDKTKALADCLWEAHQRYADIQVLLSGGETMQWETLGNTKSGEYLAEKDFVPIQCEGGLSYTFKPGMFAVFFPHDAHRPGIAVPNSGSHLKIVVKVAV